MNKQSECLSALRGDFFNEKRRPYLYSFIKNAISTESDFDLKPLSKIIGAELCSLKDPMEKKDHWILFGFFDDQCGCFGAKFTKNNVHIFDVIYDHSIGKKTQIAYNLLDFLKNEFYVKLDIKQETLKADYIGRYAWAKLDFKFSNKYWLKESGDSATFKLWQIAQRNFSRFLSKNNIDTSNLYDCRNNMSIQLSNLQHPIDFSMIKGAVINQDVLDGNKYVLPPKNMDAGKAFLLGSYLPEKNQYIISMSRAKLSNLHMPYWNGFRKI